MPTVEGSAAVTATYSFLRWAAERCDWLAAHPETARRLDCVERELADADRWLVAERDQIDGIAPAGLGRELLPTHTRELLDHLPAPEPRPEPWWQPPGREVGIDLGL